MVRKRLALLAALAGLGLVGGCSSTSCPGERTSFLDRFRRHPAPECCVMEGGAQAAPVTEGPVIQDNAMMVPAPQPGSCAQPAPITQPPRLVPQPSAQAQPRPYVVPQ